MLQIEIKTGDILDLTEGILVHGCNCQGVMGSGIAGHIRKKWPSVFEAYHDRHQASGLQLGDVIFVANTDKRQTQTIHRHLHRVTNELPTNLIVANAMTQFDYGRDKDTVYVDYAAVSAAFSRVAMLARDSGLTVNFPLIGCGLANGHWEQVAAAIAAVTPVQVNLVLWKLAQ